MARADGQKIEIISLEDLKILNRLNFTAENGNLRSKKMYSWGRSD